MGMITHVVGFRPPDDEWRKMKAAWESCEAVGAPIPDVVSAFFDDVDPGNKPGQNVNIEEAVSGWADEFSNEGYDIDLRKLPPTVKIVRVFNSY